MWKKSPKVSVLIPTYNYAHFLDEAIQSVLDQTFQDFELIIIDDHSKDNTDEIVKKYLSDERVMYYKNEKNLGLTGNWNECLRHAKGEYIKFLCADDKFHPLLLERFVGVMERYKQVSLVTSYRQTLGKSSEIIKLPLNCLQQGEKIIYHTLNSNGWLGEPSAIMFRNANLTRTGNFKTDIIWLPDWEMWIRQLTVGDCYIIPKALSIIRKHSDQLTKKVINGFVNYFEEYDLCKAINEHNGYNIDISGIDMEAVIKMRAINCAKAMYKVITALHKKKNWIVFKKSFKIAYTERVLFTPLIKFLFKKRFKKESLHQEKVPQQATA